jgi:hypothetical protein
MAKVPLQNMSGWSCKKTVDEASGTVSRWPEWKRERQLFTRECENKHSKRSEKCEENRKST